MLSCNTAFMKAGSMGLSILFASGDQGVCGREGCGFLKHKFHPDFPAASPYITAVGGTDFETKGVIGAETAWTAGGGGFSDTFAIPDYQASAVAAYKSSSAANLPPQDLWNATGRGYPDAAALGGQKNPYCIASGGRFEGVAGERVVPRRRRRLRCSTRSGSRAATSRWASSTRGSTRTRRASRT